MFELKLGSGRAQLPIERFFLLLTLTFASLLLSSCGSGSSSSSNPPSVTASCIANTGEGAGSQVTVGGQALCTASVLNLSSTLVNWSVSGTGTGPFGTIDTNSGVYTAPNSVPTNNVVTITATSQAQSTVTGTTTLTIEKATTISAVVCVPPGQITPPSPLTVASGNQLDCSATPTGGGTTAVPVCWYVNNVQNGAPATGTISTGGTYTAPLVPPPGGTITISATSGAPQCTSMNTESVMAAVVFGNKVLSNAYVFSTSGRVVNSNSFFARVGTLTIGGGDPVGSLSGIEDTNQGGTSGSLKTNRAFTGSYSIGADGRGTMEFCEDTSQSCPAGSPLATAFFRIVVVSSQQTEFIEFSSPNAASATIAASGEMLAQDPSVFGAGNGNLNGAYSFSFGGVTSAGAAQSEVGEFTADGLPDGLLFANSPATPGRVDINNGGPQPFASASHYSVSANGRGTATLGSASFSFYVISGSQSKFIETDASAILAGDAFKQQSSAACPWGKGSLQGTIVFESGGTNSTGPVTDLVSFVADGNGGVSSGSVDETSAGVLTTTTSLGGSYSIDSCGRGTLSIPANPPNHTYVFYVTAVNTALIQEVTSGVSAHGTLVQPLAGALTAASLNGSFALVLAGSNGTGPAGNEEDLEGQLTMSGMAASQSGTLPSGSVDVNNSAANTGATQTGTAQTGTYAVSANGDRATITLTFPQNLVLYIVTPTQAFAAVGTDSSRVVAVGSLFKQF